MHYNDDPANHISNSQQLDQCPLSCVIRAYSATASAPTFPIGCIRDVGFKSPVTGPNDGFLPPGRCRPVRAIQIPDGGGRESRNAGLGPLGWTGWISLQPKGLSRVFSNTTVQKHQFFGAHWDFPGKNTGVGCHFFPQGISPTQGSNPVSCIAGGLFTV